MSTRALITVAAALALAACPELPRNLEEEEEREGLPENQDDEDPEDPTDPTDPVDPTDPGSVSPGGACVADTDCAEDAAHAGLCVAGVCMQTASAACSEPGSTTECGAGLRCWDLRENAPVCWPNCDAFTCAGTCDADGSCSPNETTGAACDPAAAFYCPESGGEGGCPANAHLDGESCYCDDGFVVNAAGTGCEPGENGGGGGCPPNSHLENEGCYCDDGFSVNAEGTACVHECETDTDCSGGLVCGSGFTCQEPPCTETSCGAGMLCSASGRCVVDLGTPPAGPVPTCSDIPSLSCSGGEGTCGQLTTFSPRQGDGYWDYPLNGETEQNQYRSYARRDLVALIKYAAASVRCAASSWTVGNGGRLGLGDMSEQNGAIPGTSIGEPGHPAGTHVDGHDMDIGYFQEGTADNTLRPICDHTNGSSDAYHCVAEPDSLDVWRTALFIAKLHDSPQLRVIGVDGRVGPLIESAIDQLCAGGFVTGAACGSGLALAYETTDQGRGWFAFHHHHLHVSITDQGGFSAGSLVTHGKDACLSLAGCARPALDVDPRRVLYRPLLTRLH